MRTVHSSIPPAYNANISISHQGCFLHEFANMQIYAVQYAFMDNMRGDSEIHTEGYKHPKPEEIPLKK